MLGVGRRPKTRGKVGADMTAQQIGQAIQTILAPVLIVTSCAILTGGMLALYGATNDRMRALARERLDLLHTAGGEFAHAIAAADTYAVERLNEIDRQLPELLDRHKRIHDAILIEYCSILLLVACMFVIAVSYATRSSAVANVALILFLCGIAVMLAGVGVMAREIWLSHSTIAYEVERVLKLGR